MFGKMWRILLGNLPLGLSRWRRSRPTQATASWRHFPWYPCPMYGLQYDGCQNVTADLTDFCGFTSKTRCLLLLQGKVPDESVCPYYQDEQNRQWIGSLRNDSQVIILFDEQQSNVSFAEWEAHVREMAQRPLLLGGFGASKHE